jgi:hypothetical protein
MNPSNISFSSHLAITHWNKETGLSKFHQSGNIRRAFRIAVRGRRDARASKASDSLMGFGYEPHRCPGAAVALQEAAIFLPWPLRVPNVHLSPPPAADVRLESFFPSYELRAAMIST